MDILLSREHMFRVLPSNGHCLPSRCLATGLYVTIQCTFLLSRTQGCGIYYGCSDLRNVLYIVFTYASYEVLRNDVLVIVSYPLLLSLLHLC
jgi:hypothetical protein